MKPTQETLDREARRWGVRLEARGEHIAIVPGSKAPPEFVALVREHKPEILSWLAARADGFSQDRAPWVYVGRQVLGGEFDSADNSTRESLAIGLRSIPHPICQAALKRLGDHCGWPRNEIITLSTEPIKGTKPNEITKEIHKKRTDEPPQN